MCQGPSGPRNLQTHPGTKAPEKELVEGLLEGGKEPEAGRFQSQAAVSLPQRLRSQGAWPVRRPTESGSPGRTPRGAALWTVFINQKPTLQSSPDSLSFQERILWELTGAPDLRPLKGQPRGTGRWGSFVPWRNHPELIPSGQATFPQPLPRHEKGEELGQQKGDQRAQAELCDCREIMSPPLCVHGDGDGSWDAHSAAFSGGGIARIPAPLGSTRPQSRPGPGGLRLTDRSPLVLPCLASICYCYLSVLLPGPCRCVPRAQGSLLEAGGYVGSLPISGPDVDS
ncbi:uncharacterized protein LOC123000282 [Ursus arctos]|uniref:uncharacterized protein LOC123000282 n=1 Tax=Ursus arctos TaxID=9644 RepID=UPI0025498C13|nr:uncharacterized protein LOC123000282 [Ursus arctos]